MEKRRRRSPGASSPGAQCDGGGSFASAGHALSNSPRPPRSSSPRRRPRGARAAVRAVLAGVQDCAAAGPPASRIRAEIPSPAAAAPKPCCLRRPASAGSVRRNRSAHRGCARRIPGGVPALEVAATGGVRPGRGPTPLRRARAARRAPAPWPPGGRKVSDLLADLKFRERTAQHPLVRDAAGTVLWVAGLRRDHESRVTPSTKTALILEAITPC